MSNVTTQNKNIFLLKMQISSINHSSAENAVYQTGGLSIGLISRLLTSVLQEEPMFVTFCGLLINFQMGCSHISSRLFMDIWIKMYFKGVVLKWAGLEDVVIWN